MRKVNFLFFVFAFVVCSSSAMPCGSWIAGEILLNGGAGCADEIILVTVSEEGDYSEMLTNPGEIDPAPTDGVDSSDDAVVVESAAVKEEVPEVTDLPAEPVSSESHSVPQVSDEEADVGALVTTKTVKQ